MVKLSKVLKTVSIKNRRSFLEWEKFFTTIKFG